MTTTLKKSGLIILLAGALFCIQSMNPLHGQEYSDVRVPSVYLGPGFEVNNYGFGLGLEIPVSGKMSLTGNAGIGGWGTKIGGTINYYFVDVTGKSELSLGYSRASGLKDFSTDLYVEPNETKQTVKLDLNVVQTINLMYTYNLRIGRSVKVGFTGGYAISLTNTPYTLKTQGVTLTSTSEQVLKIMQPGGVIVGIKFMFGL
jgi:hypothetical protein